MTGSEALEALKNGGQVRRYYWPPFHRIELDLESDIASLKYKICYKGLPDWIARFEDPFFVAKQWVENDWEVYNPNPKYLINE